MPNADVLLHELLDEGLADWVPLTRITGSAREAVAADGGDHREVATALIARLIEEGLMVPGDLGHSGFQAWPGARHELVRRVVAQCQQLDWDPLGDGCWWANTDKGDRLARA